MAEDSFDIISQPAGVAISPEGGVAAQPAVSAVDLHELDLNAMLPGPIENVRERMRIGAGQDVMSPVRGQLGVPEHTEEPDAHQDEPSPDAVFKQSWPQKQKPGFHGIGKRAFNLPAEGMMPPPGETDGQSTDPCLSGHGSCHSAEGLERDHLPRRVSFCRKPSSMVRNSSRGRWSAPRDSR